MYVVNHNNFIIDTDSLRSTRFMSLSNITDEDAAEIGLSVELKQWARDSYDSFSTFRSERDSYKATSIIALADFQKVFDQALENYQKAKSLLLSFIRDSPLFNDLKDEYSISGDVPRRFLEFDGAVDRFHTAHERHKAAGDGFVVPDALEQSIVAKRDEAELIWQEVMEKRQAAKEKQDEFSAKKKSDTSKLRIVYQMAAATWGKDSTKMITMGFAQMHKRRGGGQPKAPEGLRWLPELSRIEWDASNGATSYQLVSSLTGRHWEEVYEGDQTKFVYQGHVGKKLFSVRARNKHGFGKWSETIEIVIEG